MNQRYTAHFKKYPLIFKIPVGTSRGILTKKPSYFIAITDNEREDKKTGMGEISILPNLSPDSKFDIEAILTDVCNRTDIENYRYYDDLKHLPAVLFGLEMAFQELKNDDRHVLFPSRFTMGLDHIEFNGLIWMGPYQTMLEQIKSKIDNGFRCIKIKIGAISIEEELSLMKHIRRSYSKEEIEIRVDANGAFSANKVEGVLDMLAAFDVHSIEQPIRQGQWELMSRLCANTPVPIALDEELIGIDNLEEQKELLTYIKPQFIILKPSLLGGFSASTNWINLAKEEGVRWWATSALESNVGLNAIAQWVYPFKNSMPQGLGTGSLFNNNIVYPIVSKKSFLSFVPNTFFNLDFI